jgi:branched-chain amino acid transport system ATP-binding protein
VAVQRFAAGSGVMASKTADKDVLEVEDLKLSFGGVAALNGLSLEVRHCQITAIIGPNGSGKTCALNCVSGFYRPQSGRVYFKGSDITKLQPEKITRLGIGRTFQNIELYPSLSCIDNLMVARHISMSRTAGVTGFLYFGWAHAEEIRQREKVEEIIDFLKLEAVRKMAVGALPYGIRKRIDLGRCLALEPEIMLLDEPMSGMNLEEKEDMARFILDIVEEKVPSVVLVEHDMGVVMDIADTIIVLDFGRKIAEGTPAEIRCNQQVIEAYLGAPVKQSAGS